MRISPNKLKDNLEKGISNVYIILGNESILIQELVDQIVDKAKGSDTTQKFLYIISKKTNWGFLESAEENLDLFGGKKIIELRLLGSGPGHAGAKALKEFSQKKDKKNILVVACEGLDRRSYSSSWVKALEESGVLMELPSISLTNLPPWIQTKGIEYNLEISQEACMLLADKTEGNLIATVQEIQKLSLIFPSESIDLIKMGESIANSSKYNVFDFANSFIELEKKRTLEILQHLKDEGAPESLVLWALSRAINNLFKIASTGSTVGISGPKSYLKLLEDSSKNIPVKRLKDIIKKISLIDNCIKGNSKQDPWLALREVCLFI